jgi:succinate dehydrogenase hydrophobic anchor subunit
MAMFCANCGNQLGEFSFCPSCGAKAGAEISAQTKNPAPGKNFLLVTGILHIVFDSIALMFSAIAAVSISEWVEDFGGVHEGWASYYGLFILFGLIGVAVGIMGIVLRNDPKKGKLLIWFGAIYIAVMVIVLVLSMIVLQNNSTDALEYATGMVIIRCPFLFVPILYIIGAIKNKNAAAVETE